MLCLLFSRGGIGYLRSKPGHSQRQKRMDCRYTAPEGCIMKLTSFLLALVCTTAAIDVAQNDTGSDVQSKIIALEKAWNQAYKLGDVRALDTLLDEQIVLINDDGSVQTKPEFLAGVKPSKSQEQ